MASNPCTSVVRHNNGSTSTSSRHGHSPPPPLSSSLPEMNSQQNRHQNNIHASPEIFTSPIKSPRVPFRLQPHISESHQYHYHERRRSLSGSPGAGPSRTPWSPQSHYHDHPRRSKTEHASYPHSTDRIQSFSTNRHHFAPPPLLPYVTEEKRARPPPVGAWTHSGSYPPKPENLRFERSQIPSSPENVRRSSHSHNLSSAMREQVYPFNYRTSQTQRSPGKILQGEYQLQPNDPYPHARRPISQIAHKSAPKMTRSLSDASGQSWVSSEGRPSSGDSNAPPLPLDMPERYYGHPSSSRGVFRDSHDRQPDLTRRKRTRALMTRQQQHYLKVLWRKTRFPSNADREILGAKIGLTPRQVQVWFQNQRQKHRKELNETGIPPGADPADYADLQRSPPNSRKVLNDEEDTDAMDRVSLWAGATATTVSVKTMSSTDGNPMPSIRLGLEPLGFGNESGSGNARNPVQLPPLTHMSGDTSPKKRPRLDNADDERPLPAPPWQGRRSSFHTSKQNDPDNRPATVSTAMSAIHLAERDRASYFPPPPPPAPRTRNDKVHSPEQRYLPGSGYPQGASSNYRPTTNSSTGSARMSLMNPEPVSPIFQFSMTSPLSPSYQYEVLPSRPKMHDKSDSDPSHPPSKPTSDKIPIDPLFSRRRSLSVDTGTILPRPATLLDDHHQSGENRLSPPRTLPRLTQLDQSPSLAHWSLVTPESKNASLSMSGSGSGSNFGFGQISSYSLPVSEANSTSSSFSITRRNSSNVESKLDRSSGNNHQQQQQKIPNVQSSVPNTSTFSTFNFSPNSNSNNGVKARQSSFSGLSRAIGNLPPSLSSMVLSGPISSFTSPKTSISTSTSASLSLPLFMKEKEKDKNHKEGKDLDIDHNRSISASSSSSQRYNKLDLNSKMNTEMEIDVDVDTDMDHLSHHPSPSYLKNLGRRATIQGGFELESERKRERERERERGMEREDGLLLLPGVKTLLDGKLIEDDK